MCDSYYVGCICFECAKRMSQIAEYAEEIAREEQSDVETEGSASSSFYKNYEFLTASNFNTLFIGRRLGKAPVVKYSFKASSGVESESTMVMDDNRKYFFEVEADGDVGVMRVWKSTETLDEINAKMSTMVKLVSDEDTDEEEVYVCKDRKDKRKRRMCGPVPVFGDNTRVSELVDYSSD